VRLNPDLPAKLEEIINRAIEKDRNLRYQHASDLRAELQRLKRDSSRAARMRRLQGQAEQGSPRITGCNASGGDAEWCEAKRLLLRRGCTDSGGWLIAAGAFFLYRSYEE
jgi:hypothetical protein